MGVVLAWPSLQKDLRKFLAWEEDVVSWVRVCWELQGYYRFQQEADKD